MDVRLVVTGHDNNGKAVFASNDRLAPITPRMLPGAEFHRVWGSDEPQTYPDDGAAPPAHDYLPPLGGFRFVLELDAGVKVPLSAGDVVVQTVEDATRAVADLFCLVAPGDAYP